MPLITKVIAFQGTPSCPKEVPVNWPPAQPWPPAESAGALLPPKKYTPTQEIRIACHRLNHCLLLPFYGSSSRVQLQLGV